MAGIKEFSAGAYEILDSGDLDRIRGLFRDLLTMVLKVVMTTAEAELIEFIERLVQEIENCTTIRHQGRVLRLKATAGIAQPCGSDAAATINRVLSEAAAAKV